MIHNARNGFHGGGGGGSCNCSSFIVSLFLLLIAVSALVLSGMAFENSRPEDVTLVLEDNTTQQLLGSGIWTSIEFHRQLHSSLAWKHSPVNTDGDDDSSLIECRRDGIYRAYFSVQLDLLKPGESNGTLHCQSGRLRHEIRATIQFDGQGLLHEIRCSHTRGDRDATFMSKEFLFHADEGDLLRFQFYSLCYDAILISGGESQFSNSATLLISHS